MYKVLALGALLAAMTMPVEAQYRTYGTGSNYNNHYVAPHVNRNGSYTSGHYRTNPNNTQFDNYGTRGNYNPHTGRTGTRNPWR